MHLLDFDKVVSELGVINQTDACVVLKRDPYLKGQHGRRPITRKKSSHAMMAASFIRVRIALVMLCSIAGIGNTNT